MDSATLEQRLEKVESLLQILVDRQTVKDWYTTNEAADLLDRKEFTIREWCRLGRIHAQKRTSGRGPHAAWVISHEELQRYQKDGLLTVPRGSLR
jgi:hypothetical protein